MAESETLFTNVKILDGSGAAPFTGEVLVRGRRIQRIARSARSFSNGQSTVIDGAIERACVTSLGRRAAAKHLAHVISELLLRLETVGLTRGNSFDFPLKQADVADLIGLSLVHTNRTIQELRSLGLIRWDGKVMTITDLAQLHEYAEFDPTYLNLVKRPR